MKLHFYVSENRLECMDGCFMVQCFLIQNFPFAAVQNGGECYCDTSYGRYGPASNCDKQCSGDSKLICGGVWANYVLGSERNAKQSYQFVICKSE